MDSKEKTGIKELFIVAGFCVDNSHHCLILDLWTALWSLVAAQHHYSGTNFFTL